MPDAVTTRIRFPFQPGGAITLPVPFVGPVIFYRLSRPDIMVHEEVHAGQCRKMGGLRYLCAHISQRNSMYGCRPWSPEWRYGKAVPLEAEAYEAQAAFWSSLN